jgi:hypothetical protein
LVESVIAAKVPRLCHNPPMNPFRIVRGWPKVADSNHSYSYPSRVQLPWTSLHYKGQSLQWPEDYRAAMCWLFALNIFGALFNLGRDYLHPRTRTLLQNLLVGPAWYAVMAAMSSIALWALWKEKRWARAWAVATSSLFLLEFAKQYFIHVRPAWDHYVSALIAGVAGVAAFCVRDR